MRESTKGYLLCFSGVFTWSFSEITVKLLHGAAGPYSLSFLRFFLGAFFLLFLLATQRHFRQDIKDMGMISRKYLKILIIGSAVGLGVSNMLYFVGLQLTQANIGAALYTTYPIFVSIYGIFILKERSNIPFKLLGYFLGIIGIIILMTNFQIALLFQPQNILGNVLLVSAAALWGLYSVMGKIIFRAEGKTVSNIEIKYTIISFIFACIPIFPVIIFSTEWSGFFQYEVNAWGFILFLAFFSTGFGLYIFFIGVRKIEVSRGMSLSLLKPIMVSIFAYPILGEVPSIALVITIILVSTAVILINRPIKKTQLITITNTTNTQENFKPN